MTYNVSKVPAIIYKLTLAEPIIQTDIWISQVVILVLNCLQNCTQNNLPRWTCRFRNRNLAVSEKDVIRSASFLPNWWNSISPALNSSPPLWYEYSDDKYFKRMSVSHCSRCDRPISPQMKLTTHEIPKNINNLPTVLIWSYLQLCSTHRWTGRCICW